MTKEKYIKILREIYPEEVLLFGYYYETIKYHKSWLIVIKDLVLEQSCICEIYSIPLPQEEGEHVSVNILDEIPAWAGESNLEFSINIWGKYYFPSFPQGEYQWYHGHNEINAMAEVMEAALKLGLEKAKIIPY